MRFFLRCDVGLAAHPIAGRARAYRGAVGSVRLEPFLDAYNIFNANTVLGDVTTVGASLGAVSTTINPRLMRIGAKVGF